MSEIISSDDRSNRAWWSTLGDALGRKLWPLDAGSLVAAARRRTGLEDFGDPPLEPALSILGDSLEQEADLHPLGRFLMRVHLQDLLETRLRLADLWRARQEEMAAARVCRPIFITGMPRSGSTYLHELLAEDPDNRAPRVWEVMFPIPPRGRRQVPDPRIRKAAACLWWFRRFAPQADTVFPLRAGTPHECVAIQSYSLLSEEFISTCRVPAFESFLRQTDLRPAYAWERRFLQHLQFRSPERRWVLKSPDHAYGLEALFAVFPDAQIIQTHRNPIEVLKSSCHLTEVLHGLYGWPDVPERLAARESRVLAQGLNRFLNFRDTHPELAGRFVDVKYQEIVDDPLEVIRRVYEKFGLPLTPAAGERMARLAHQRSRYDHRRTGTASFEARPVTIAEASCFKRYCSRFKVGWGQTRSQ
jgi:hypothetical protein